MPEKTAHVIAIYNDICRLLLSADLDKRAIIDQLTERAVSLTGAQFGAYFVDTTTEEERGWSLYSLHGAPVEAFTRFGRPRITGLFKPTFDADGVICSHDILDDERYGSLGGMPVGHLPVRSYLAVPVMSSKSCVQGALLFGHAEPGMFTDRTVGLIESVAALAAVALDNAARFEELKREAEYRQLLLAELNHRVKNTLATVQGIINSTVRSTPDPDEFAESVTGRIHAIAATHNLLTDSNWTGALLIDVVRSELQHYDLEGSRLRLEGPRVMLQAAAVTGFGMVMHELATNAIKYGAFSVPTGSISVKWHVASVGGEQRLKLEWVECQGPAVTKPSRSGFGSRLLRSIGHQFSGSIQVQYRTEGVRCLIDLPLEGISPGIEPSKFLITRAA